MECRVVRQGSERWFCRADGEGKATRRSTGSWAVCLSIASLPGGPRASSRCHGRGSDRSRRPVRAVLPTGDGARSAASWAQLVLQRQQQEGPYALPRVRVERGVRVHLRSAWGDTGGG